MTRPGVATRLNRSDREQQILEAAARLVVEQGCLPLPMEALGARAGVSKALVYAYFPNQAELARRLLALHLARLGKGLEAIMGGAAASEMERGLACAELYFDHVARHGALLHVLLSDPLSVAGLTPDLQRLYERLMRTLARALHKGFGAPRSECVAALHILLALPEETGNLVFRGRLDPDLGRLLARRLMDGALSDLQRRILQPPGRPTRSAAPARRP
jgi:AcrR family transcriptional regulator